MKFDILCTIVESQVEMFTSSTTKSFARYSTNFSSFYLHGFVFVTANYHFTCKMKGNKVESETGAHLVFEKMNCQIDMGKTRIHMEGLFRDNAVAAKATIDAINDSIDVFIAQIKPNLVDTLNNVFTDAANNITAAMDYSEMFPL